MLDGRCQDTPMAVVKIFGAPVGSALWPRCVRPMTFAARPRSNPRLAEWRCIGSQQASLLRSQFTSANWLDTL